MEGRAKELSDNIESLNKYKTLFQENQDCLNTVLNNLSKMGVDDPVYNRTIVIRNWTKNRIKDTEKQLRKLYKEQSDIWNNCEHESYLIANPITAIMIYICLQKVWRKSIIGNKEITRCLSD